MVAESELEEEEEVRETEKIIEPRKENQTQTQTQTQELQEVKQTFRVRPEDTQVRMGENVYLCCIVDHQQGKAQWTKDGFALGECACAWVRVRVRESVRVLEKKDKEIFLLRDKEEVRERNFINVGCLKKCVPTNFPPGC